MFSARQNPRRTDARLPSVSQPHSLARVSDRLDELRRQRALVQQHLDWLDEEIAAESLADPTRVPVLERPRATLAPPANATAGTPPDPDALLAKYRTEAQASPAKVKLGCWVAFLAAFATFWGAIAVWYWLRAR